MQHKCCFFIGHRDAPKTLLPLIRDAIEEHVVNYHVTEFIVGQYGSFDRMVAKALLQVKEGHTEIKLTLLLPYYSCTTRSLPDGFDESLFPSAQEHVPKRLAIVRANQYAVDISDYLIAYAWQPGSNALKLLDYAQRKRNKRPYCTNLYGIKTPEF